MAAGPTSVSGLGAPARSTSSRGRRRLEETLERILQEGFEDGSIARCDTRMSAFTIFGALHWLCFWYREGGPLTPAQIAERMITLFTRGLEPTVRCTPRCRPRASRWHPHDWPRAPCAGAV
jgi:hypothetical protein